MTLYNIIDEYIDPEASPEEIQEAITDIKEYFCKLLEPYIGDDFRAAERTIRNA